MKNLQKGFVVPILIGIIALLVIVGGFYIYEIKKVETPAVADNTTQQSKPVQETNTQNSPINNQQNVPVVKTAPVSNSAMVKSSVTVSSPNGQEVWINGSQQTIRWTSKGSDAREPVEIILERKAPNDTQFWTIGTIATNQPGSGSYTWTVSSKDTTGNIIANSQYKILIGRNLAKGIGPVDESDSYFLIATPTTQPSITVLYPNVGEVLNNGGRTNIATIKWNSSDIGNSNVRIIAIDKANNVRTIVSDAPNTGSYDWKMDPTIASGQYKINVATTQNGLNISDSSDGYFVIYTKTIVPGKTFVILVSPNGGESLTTGSKVLIKWLNLGEKPTSANIYLMSNARCPWGYVCTPLANSFANIAKLSGNDLNKGEYEWTVGKSGVDDHGNGYLIGITTATDNFGSSSADDSDSYFTIN